LSHWADSEIIVAAANVAPTANKSRRAKLVSFGIDPLHCPNRVNVLVAYEDKYNHLSDFGRTAEQTQLDCSGAPPPLYFRCIFSGGAAVEWVSVFDKMAA
jgi:hypothetical protein